MKRKIFIIASIILTSVLSTQAQEEIAVIDSIMATTQAEEVNDSIKGDKDDILLTYKEPIIYMHPHHFAINIGGGLHTMITDPQNGQWGIGFGGLFEMKYQLLSKHIGLSIGGKLSMHNGSTTADFSEQTYRTHMGNGQMCRFTTTYQGWKEKESLWTVEIPIQMIIASGINKPWNFHAALGVSAYLPINGKYNVTEGNITTTGYFEQTKIEMHDLPTYGFGTIEASSIKKEDIDYARFGLNGIVDLGLLHNITHEAGLYIGIYGSYGILNAYKGNDALPYEYSANGNGAIKGFQYAGLYNSNYISKILPVEAGVKLGILFSFHDTKKEIEETNKELAERVDIERQAADAAAAERAAKAEEKNRRQELQKAAQQRLADELKDIQEASRWEATQALKTIKDAAKYANINATPIFPSTIDQDFITLRKYLDSHSDAKIIITGHTDNSGTPAKNIINGQHRAEAFKTALVKKNIPSSRIGCVSKGETEPIGDNDTPEGRAMNNRVDLDIVDQSSAIMNNSNEITPTDDEQ